VNADITFDSINSIDDMLALDVPEDASESWKQELADRMEEIIDRKRSSVQGRETTLAQYVHILMSHYALEDIKHRSAELFPAFLKSIKAENTEKETCLALRGLLNYTTISKKLPLTTCSNRAHTHYDSFGDNLRRHISDFETHLHRFRTS
jgi:hypothetical protein